MEQIFFTISKLSKMKSNSVRIHKSSMESKDVNTNIDTPKTCEEDDFNKPSTSMRNYNSKRVRFQTLETIIEISEEKADTSHIKKKVTWKPITTAPMEINFINRPLLQQIHIQTQIMIQVTKALCLAKPGSIEEVEGHKILLFSELRRHANMCQLPIICELYYKPKDILYQVKFKTIYLSVKTILSEFEKIRKEEESVYTNYYVCIARSGTKVLCSNISNGVDIMCFDKEMIFDKLLPNFYIQLAFYNLRYNSLTIKQRESKWSKLKNIFENGTGNDSLDFIAKSKFNLIGRSHLHRTNVAAQLGYYKLFTPVNSLFYEYLTVDCVIFP